MYSLPSGVGEPAFALLHRYWESKRRAGRLPARSDIDPTEIPALLPQLLLFEVIAGADGPRFRFRLAGTAFTHLVGRDVTGFHLDELGPPDRVAPVAQALAAVVRTGRPAYLAGRLTLRSEKYMIVRRLGFPLAADGARVDMILGLWLAQPWSMSDRVGGALEGSAGELILLEGD